MKEITFFGLNFMTGVSHVLGNGKCFNHVVECVLQG